MILKRLLQLYRRRSTARKLGLEFKKAASFELPAFYNSILLGCKIHDLIPVITDYFVPLENNKDDSVRF